MAKTQNTVQMAVIGAAHGIRGEVRVRSFTGDPLALGDYGPLHDAAGRAYAVAAIRPAKDMVVVRFEGVDTREAAEALNGTALFIDRARLPADLEPDEFYHADLIGLAAFDEAGERVGRIVAVHDFGGGDLLEIALPFGKTVMVPFTAAAVPGVDLGEGRVRVDRRAAGLMKADGNPGGGGRR